MKEILVINLTRIGDLIQTTPLLRALRTQHPQARITLVVNATNRGIAALIPDYHRLLLFAPEKEVPSSNGVSQLAPLYLYLKKFVEDLAQTCYDLAVNLTHDHTTAIMLSLLDCADTRGLCASSDGKTRVYDSWLTWFAGVKYYRSLNPFNLVDLYQFAAGLDQPHQGLCITEDAVNTSIDHLLPDDALCFGVQAGASLSERRWPPERFAAAADRIASEHQLTPLLFGAPSERELGQRIAGLMQQPHINLVGKTSLAELTALLKRCRFLITNDTGSMHIATAVDTPSVALFPVHARAAETGPYAAGSICIEPRISCHPCLHNTTCPHYACLDFISVDHVAQAVNFLTRSIQPEPSPDARFFQTGFDPSGAWICRPLIKEPATLTEITARVYRQVKRPCEDWLDMLLADYCFTSDHQPLLITLRKSMLLVRDFADKAATLCRKLARSAEKGDQAYIEQHVAKLVAIDSELENLGHTHPETAPITRGFQLATGSRDYQPTKSYFQKNASIADSAKKTASDFLACLSQLEKTAISS